MSIFRPSPSRHHTPEVDVLLISTGADMPDGDRADRSRRQRVAFERGGNYAGDNRHLRAALGFDHPRS